MPLGTQREWPLTPEVCTEGPRSPEVGRCFGPETPSECVQESGRVGSGRRSCFNGRVGSGDSGRVGFVTQEPLASPCELRLVATPTVAHTARLQGPLLTLTSKPEGPLARERLLAVGGQLPGRDWRLGRGTFFGALAVSESVLLKPG